MSQLPLTGSGPTSPSGGGGEPPAELGGEIPARLRESDGTVYYVDNETGNNADDGLSQGNAWQTIAHAVTTAAANGIIKVVTTSTDYAGATITRNMGSAANLLTIEALTPGDPPVINAQMHFNTADFMRFRNFIIDGTGGDPDTWSSLLGCDSSNNLEFYGITCRNSPGFPTAAGAACQGFQPDNCSSIWWVNCVSHSNGNVDARDHGWYVESGSNYYFLNCISYGNAGYGFHVYNGSSTSETYGPLYFYNCLSDDNFKVSTGRSGWIVQSDHDGNSTSQWKNVHFYNCISSNHADGSTNQSGWRFRFQNAAQAEVDAYVGGYPKNTLNNCLAYNNEDGDLDFTSGGASEASYITNTGFITGQDPLFTNQAGRDYTLQSGSPCEGAGLADYTPTFDITGAARTAADIGPYAA